MQKLNKILVLGISLFWATAAAVSPKDTLVIQNGNGIPTLDPGATYDLTSGGVVENIYETLVTYKGNSLRQLEPLLATKWAVSNGGKTFTFDLRKGVKFHNGDPFTCADAEYTFRRNLVTNNSNSSNWFLAESLLGTQDNAYTDKSITWARISNAVKCNAAGQLVLTLAKPEAAFLSKLAYAGQSIVNRKYAAGLGEWSGTESDWKAWIGKDLSESKLSQKPVGTGAYRMLTNTASSATFQAFDGYWGGKPSIKNVLRQVVAELATRQQALLKGDADVIGGGGRAVDEVQLKGKPGIAWIDGIADTTAGAIFMNQKVAAGGEIGSGKLDGKGIPANFFSDVNVRRGFNYAFNAQRYITDVFKGKATVRTMLLPDSFLGYDEKIPTYKYDPAQAKAALQKAWGGQVWQNGFTLTAYYAANNSDSQTALQILKQGVESLNPKFRINVEAKPWDELWSGSSRGEQALILLSWSPDYADPDNFMYTFYASDGYYAPRSNYRDSKTDAWLTAARTSPNISERLRYYSRVAERAYEQAAYITLPASTGYLVFSSRLGGISQTSSNLMSNSVLGVLWKDMTKK